jgi:hypothetical protein
MIRVCCQRLRSLGCFPLAVLHFSVKQFHSTPNASKPNVKEDTPLVFFLSPYWKPHEAQDPRRVDFVNKFKLPPLEDE